MSRLVLCSSCSRHVHAGEASCPFCASPAHAFEAPPTLGLDATARYSRAKLCALAAALAACNAARPAPSGPGSRETSGAAVAPSSERPATVATAPPEDAKAPDAVVMQLPPPHEHMVRPLYGAPPAFVDDEV